jgi:hypothetical protein
MLATVHALYRRCMTRFRHQSGACRYPGIIRLTLTDGERFQAAFVEDTTITVDPIN